MPLDAVGAPVIVITRNDIERSLASDVSELLQTHAGLEIARNGGPGQTTSLFTRGTESNHTVVLVDGVRINPGTIGGAALQNIAPESLERIEIVKGPRSSLYGTDAIGGVVQLFTRGAAKDGVSTGATYGSDATQQLFGDAALSAGEQFKLGFGGSYAESDGMPDLRRRRHRSRLSQRHRRVRSPNSPRPTRSQFRARGWRSRRAHRVLGADLQRSAVRGRLAGFREQRVFVRRRIPRAATAFGVRATVSRALDDIEQLQAGFGPAEFDYAHTQRDQRRRAGGPGAARHACAVSFGVQRSDENTRAQSFGTVFDEDTLVDAGLRAGSVRDRPAHLAARARARWTTRPSATKLTWNAEFGAAFGQRHAPHAERRQRLPRARQHRPVRLRRQSGSRSGGVASRSSSPCARS